jgi:hypothetical protein
MRETETRTRLKAWVRAVRCKDWVGEGGRWFRESLVQIGRFGRDELKIGEKLESAHEAIWARAEGTLVGKDQAAAVVSWQEAENKRIQAKLSEQTFEQKVGQENTRTSQMKAEVEKTRAEAEKLRAEALKIRVDAAITLADRLLAAKVWIVPDENGGLHIVPIPEGADIARLYFSTGSQGAVEPKRPTPSKQDD